MLRYNLYTAASGSKLKYFFTAYSCWLMNIFLNLCKQKLTMQENGKQECKKTENKNAPFSSLNIQIFKELNRR